MTDTPKGCVVVLVSTAGKVIAKGSSFASETPHGILADFQRSEAELDMYKHFLSVYMLPFLMRGFSHDMDIRSFVERIIKHELYKVQYIWIGYDDDQ